MAGAPRPRLSRAELTALCSAAFRQLGVDAEAAEDAAEILVIAEMMGIETHGVTRVLSYGERLRTGGIDAKARIDCSAAAPGLRRVQGANALGPAVAARALKEAMAAARDTGIAAAFCQDSNHIGAVAPYCWLASREGFASLIASNATPMIAPSGGREARIGNNPLGCGFPDPGGQPFLLDMALSVVSRSRIRNAAKKGERIPETWATDLEGRPTSDARVAVDGLLQPIGGYKGAGLALFLDLLAGVLSGSTFLTGVKSLSEEPDARQDLGQFFILIDTARLQPGSALAERLALFRRLIEETPAVDPEQPVRLPGQRALENLRCAEAQGVELDPALLEALRDLAG
ncbi:MAG: Ldh family oxidoreductase [Limibacillus sp.]